MSFFSQTNIAYADTPAVDAFSRLRISNPEGLFDNQFTYNLSSLIFEPIINGSGANVTFDSTDRAALMTFASTPTGGKAFMQSFEFIPYQPGKSQQIFLTFNFIESKTNVLKFAGYSDGTNGVEFQLNGSTLQFLLTSGTGHGVETVTQSNWNLDKFDGTGPSGITLDITKVQILCIDLQALYVGRVRIGFDIAGQILYAHEFLHANIDTSPFVQSANLPIRCGMTCTGTVSTTMKFICSEVSSEGGSPQIRGRGFSQEGTVTASSGARTHLLSIRPKTTFNSITNRIKFDLDAISILVTGNNPVLWELVIGQAITGTTTFNDVNATYSAFAFNTAGTISGSPAIVIASGYVASSATVKDSINQVLTSKYPITLDAAGAVRANGTLSLLVTGLGGTSATRGVMNWREIR